MKFFLPLLSVSLLCVAAYAADDAAPPPVIDLPQMGEPADLAMSPAQEKALGRKVVTELYSNRYILEDPELHEYVSAIGWKLAASSASPPPELAFFMIADDRINAFALPGGFIGVNAGLLLAASNESEVAGVLGHELAHVTQRHIARSQNQGKAANIATWAAVLAAILAGSANPDVIIGALSIGQAITYERSAAYTRAHEQEADRIGILTLAGAGYDARGMSSFFSRLEQQSRLYGSGLPDILRTHPLNTARISEARARAEVLPHIDRKDPLDFSLMQARVRVQALDNFSAGVEYFAGQLAVRDTPANRYGYAYALSERGQYAEALAALEPALKLYPRQVNLNLLKGKSQLAAGQNKDALVTLALAQKLYPRYAPALFAYADALIATSKPEEARALLISSEQALGTRLETYSLLAQAARDMKNNAEASFQMASFLYLRGDVDGAMFQLEAGLRLANLNKQDRARLQAKRQEIRDSLPRDWRPPRDDGRRAALRSSRDL